MSQYVRLTWKLKYSLTNKIRTKLHQFSGSLYLFKLAALYIIIYYILLIKPSLFSNVHLCRQYRNLCLYHFWEIKQYVFKQRPQLPINLPITPEWWIIHLQIVCGHLYLHCTKYIIVIYKFLFFCAKNEINFFFLFIR